MPEDGNVAPQREPDAITDLLPHISGGDWLLRENRAAGIGLRLETEHPPDVTALRIGEIPANHFRHVIDVAPRDGEAERVLENETGFLANAQREISERLPHRVQ